MEAFLQGPGRVWERNGNIVVSQSPSQTASLKPDLRSVPVDSDLSSQMNSDWNSNQFLFPEQDNQDDSCFDKYSKDNANKEYNRKASSPTSGSRPPSKELSYDDLSKNIDMNLAEIDMETFRSEDIHSILALPAIYSADFQAEETSATSLLLDMDASTRSTRPSEDEISISKDSPLFSPLREPQTTISVDSLDNSYEQDLVLTCKANKNNYTIVFEGSSTQFSDDSDYQDVLKSSNGEGQVNYNTSFKKQTSMVQSDVAFTTWSKLWKSQRFTRRRSVSDSSTKISNDKSQSLPNLSHSSVFITDKQLQQWAKWCGNHRFPLYEIVQEMHECSLLKLFLKHKVSSHTTTSGHSTDSSTSLILQPLNFRNASLQNSLNTSKRNDNDTWNAVQEANNINNNTCLRTEEEALRDNNNMDVSTVAAQNEDDNSQYFEDSLMDTPSPPLKHFHATPIKEEEETDISSGDEVMKDSKIGSDDSSSGEVTVIQTGKSNVGKVYTLCNINKGENLSQSTQTKQFNINDTNAFTRPLTTFGCKTSSNQTDCDTTATTQSTTSRDSSPASSGYVSSRHSSVERLRPSSQSNGTIVKSNETIVKCNGILVKSNGTLEKSNVILSTTCTCGTQIPVHVKDSCAQTCTLGSSSTSSGFTLKESTIHLPEPNQCSSQTSVKSPIIQSVDSETSTSSKKSIYVCYPNYSLPDLSFLRSVIDETSESIYMTPTEYKPPKRSNIRPKSYGAYENLLQKHLTKIKDWDSLNVLLPDDLKQFLSKTQGKNINKSDDSHIHMSSSFSKASDPCYKKHVPRSILRKSNSVEQCEAGQCRIHLPTRCTSANNVTTNKDIIGKEQELCEGLNLSPLKKASFENCKEKNLLVKDDLEEQHGSCLHGKKAVKFCERSPTKSSKPGDACKSSRCCSCDKTSEAEKLDEFLVSPTQNTLMYQDISDSYILQNFSGGGKFFQEALRRKTGLVENLRKATQIIFEHHKNSKKKGANSIGQKILTWLCPAVHTILSDGLLPSVQGFFGPLPNSPWKVAGASIKQGETRKDVEDLLNQVTSEKLLTDSTYRFNAFILGLLNLGCFEWWLGHLCTCQSLICHHYHPTALLSLLALPAAVHLRHELKELVSPLSSLPFSLDTIFETKVISAESNKESLMDLHLSPYKQKTDFSLKNKTSPCHLNIECPEEAVWPGITINPFPHFADEPPRSRNFLRDTLLPHPRPSLCSSTDSGCSLEHQHTTNTAGDESPCVDQKETQQFKILRQKWEKISNKQPSKTTLSSKMKSPKDHPVAVPKTPPNRRSRSSPVDLSSPTSVPKTPPNRRSRPLFSPPLDDVNEKRKSQIPTLKFVKPKSMIPVQKLGVRAKSAPRFSSD